MKHKVKAYKKRLNQIWSQVPPDYYDKGIAKNYFQKFWHTRKLRQIVNLIPKDSATVLDVGCSSAVLTAQIAKELPGSKVTGVDIYKKAIDFAKIKYPHLNLFVADAQKLPFRGNVFDLVICSETLEHVLDPSKALLEIRRVLRKNGKAIISMDSGSLLFRIVWYFWLKTRGRVWKDAHIHVLNADILEDLIREAGFTINKKAYSHMGMSVIFLLSK